MKRRYDILTFGDTCVDLILRDENIVPRFGQVEKLIADYNLVMGGSCCIFAAGAAKLGLKVALLGRVGDDAFGELIRHTLDAAGVDTRYLQTDSTLRTGLTAHLVRGDDRAMLTMPGSVSSLSSAHISDEILASARHLHYGSLFLQTGLLPDWIAILRRARAQGMSVSLDTNWDPSEAWDIDLEAALPLIDILLPNEQEALRLAGAESLAEAAARLRENAPTLVIKRGSAGAIAWRDGVEAAQTVSAADAEGDGIGAGDSFDAGFVAGWLADMPLESCLSLACDCGRAAASSIGGVDGQLWRDDLPVLGA